MNNICNLIEHKKIIDKDSIYYFWKSCIKQEELFNECNVLDFCSINNPFYAYYSADVSVTGVAFLALFFKFALQYLQTFTF